MDLVEAHAGGFTQSIRHPWEVARLALAHRLIRRHTSLDPGGVVVDVGCGDTFVAESLGQTYPRTQVYAVDNAFTRAVVDSIAQRLSVPNVELCHTVEDVPRTRPASLLLLMDVLEHVADDLTMLKTLARSPLVDDATRFLITVPAYTSLVCSHDRFLGHYRRYSTRTFGDLLERAGLVAVQSGGLFVSLIPLRVAQVIRERLLPAPRVAPAGLAAWRGGPVTSSLLARVLEVDGLAAMRLQSAGVRLPGLSHFAVCRTSV